MNNINEALLYGRNFLKEHGIESYVLDAKVLLMKAANLNTTQVYTATELDTQHFLEYNNMLKERAKNKPVAYITNSIEFMSLDFYVNESVLIPRPDTEILVEQVVHYIKQNNYQSVLDIGTGSGAIAISTKYYTDISNVSAVDISEKALDIAKQNASYHNININFLQSNLFENINDKFDIIVSNPPYISTHIIDSLEPNVKAYEPLLALDGGSDGLLFYKNIVAQVCDYINDGGMIFFEIGYDQALQVCDMLQNYGFMDINVINDLAGLNRVVYGTFH